uniref:Uncharacterized protein n=1 Tax=Arundo donax TaxID=35708 RepID=A0A0A9GVT3_ARUDO
MIGHSFMSCTTKLSCYLFCASRTAVSECIWPIHHK